MRLLRTEFVPTPATRNSPNGPFSPTVDVSSEYRALSNSSNAGRLKGGRAQVRQGSETGHLTRLPAVCGSVPQGLPQETSYALSKRPDILGFCEAVTLAAAMGSVKVWR